MRYSLKLRDWLKGLLMAIAVPVLLAVQQSLEAGELTLKWKQLLMAAISGLVAYLIKNFFTDDVKTAVKVLDEADRKGVDIPKTPTGDTVDLSKFPPSSSLPNTSDK